MLFSCVLPFLATKGSRVLEKKEIETQVSKLCSATLSYFVTVGYAHLRDFVIPGLILKRTVTPGARFSKVPEVVANSQTL